MPFAVRASIAVCLTLAASSVVIAAPSGGLEPPTREEREAFRKSHVKLTGMTEPMAASEQAIAAAQDDVNILSYFIQLEFIPASRSVAGSVTITGQSLVPGFQHLVLDLRSNMSVSAVKRGTTSLVFVRPTNLVDITLDQSFGVGQQFTVQVTYSGVPDATGFGSISWRKTSGGALGAAVSTLSEPDGARTWWPCKDRPDDKANVEMWWTVPNTWTATGNGKLIGTVAVAGNKTQYKWKPTDPLTTYLVSCAATGYSTFSHTYVPLAGGTMPVDYYVYPEHLASAQASFTPTVAMITFFAQTFGEYPFVTDKYGMTEFVWGGAMEHSTNTSYGTALVNGLHNYDYIIAHELSHQWWGDAVSPRIWADVWLNEGFASYSEALWFEHLNGPAAYRNYMNSAFWSPSFTGTIYNPVDLFGSTVYDKGAWAQHMLRHVVGDANFFNTLRDWYAQHDNSIGDTAGYQAQHEARYGGSLDWFFQEWVYQGGQPAYEYGWTTADLGNGTFRTYVRIRQTQGGVFTMPVDLNLYSGGNLETYTVWNDQADQDFAIVTSAFPTTLVFDENDWILKSSETNIALADADADGVPDLDDNCVGAVNPTQTDFDLDGAGDACDPDDDNDGLADGSDCNPLDPAQGTPGLVDGIAVTGTGHVTWNAAARAASHDLQRGTLTALAASADYGSCLAPQTAGTAYDDADVPAEGDGFFYLVRGHDAGCGGGGSLGDDSAGSPRPAACP